MKRRTRLILIGCAATSGTFLFAAPAHARPAEPLRHTVAYPASDPPPRVVHAPTGRVTVRTGDTLSAIGARTSRSWEQLASYNQIPNPDLIYVDQVLTIPPPSYVPVALKAPPVPAASAPTSVSNPPTSVSSSPVGGGGVWACMAQRESGMTNDNTGNGYYGYWQDTIGSWQSAGGGPGLPSDYSYAVQLAVNQRIQAQQGWGAWPNTSAACGV